MNNILTQLIVLPISCFENSTSKRSVHAFLLMFLAPNCVISDILKLFDLVSISHPVAFMLLNIVRDATVQIH